jgi:hypothetical protein
MLELAAVENGIPLLQLYCTTERREVGTATDKLAGRVKQDIKREEGAISMVGNMLLPCCFASLILDDDCLFDPEALHLDCEQACQQRQEHELQLLVQNVENWGHICCMLIESGIGCVQRQLPLP